MAPGPCPRSCRAGPVAAHFNFLETEVFVQALGAGIGSADVQGDPVGAALASIVPNAICISRERFPAVDGSGLTATLLIR